MLDPLKLSFSKGFSPSKDIYMKSFSCRKWQFSFVATHIFKCPSVFHDSFTTSTPGLPCLFLQTKHKSRSRRTSAVTKTRKVLLQVRFHRRGDHSLCSRRILRICLPPRSLQDKAQAHVEGSSSSSP